MRGGGVAALAPGYRDLLDRAVAVCENDLRVRALWLGGSVARGAADAGSDLDLLVAVADEELTGFAAGWRDWLARITPVLLSRELPDLPGSFFATTTDCLRLDVVCEPVAALERTPYRHRSVLLDRDGLTRVVPSPEAAPGVDLVAVERIVEEFFRQQAIFPAAVVARGDWLLGQVGVHATAVLLYQLFAACNEPSPPMGVKQWSARLTADQRELLASLPAPAATHESVVAAMGAVRAAFLDTGRRTAEAAGARWPVDVDRAVARYWRAQGLVPAQDCGAAE